MTKDEYEREIASDSIYFSRTIELLRIMQKTKFNAEGLFDMILGFIFLIPSIIYDCILAPVELLGGKRLPPPW